MLVLKAFLAISEGLVSDNQISLPGLNKLFFWKNIPVERAVLPSKIEHTLKLEPGWWNLQTVIANCQLYSALNLKDQSK